MDSFLHSSYQSCGEDKSEDESFYSDDGTESTSKVDVINKRIGKKENQSDEEFEEEGTELNMDFDPKTELTTSRSVSSFKTFSDLGIGRWLCDQLAKFAIKSPTSVQASCIPEILAGADVLGCAKTGTGKTLAFALPILQQLAVDPYGVYALILTPTRELALQIGDQFDALGKSICLKTSVVVGGKDYVTQSLELSQLPHIVTATPGRLSDHIESDPNCIAKAFNKICFLVLDEADRLLDGQYALQIKKIFTVLPKKRQTLLFSATITSALSQLHQVSIKKPYFFEDKDETATVNSLDQKYVLCPRAVKDAYLVYVVKNFYQRRENSLILIFSHSCRECQALAIMFNGLGFQVGSLHSQISQRDRTSSLTRFRSGRIRILICTDVAARGLDIPHVDLVVNHNVPKSPKTYIHRVGRSARAGRFGGAITFITQYDVALFQEVEKLIGKKLELLKVDDKKVTQYVAQVLITKREAEIKLERQNFGEKKEINKRKDMVLAGLHPEEVDLALREQRNRRKVNFQRDNDPRTSSWTELTANRKRKSRSDT